MKTTIALFAHLLLITALTAQEECSRWSLGSHFTLFAPTEAMQDYNFGTVYGIGFSGLYNLTPQARFMGFHIGARIRGGVTEARKNTIILQAPRDAPATRKVYNTLVDFDLIARLNFAPGRRFQPYAEVSFGGRGTGTNEAIVLKRLYADYDRRTNDRVLQGGAFKVGTTSGILIRLNRHAFLDLGISYVTSGSTKFTDLSSRELLDNDYAYSSVSQQANSIDFHIGFQVALPCRSSRYHSEEEEYRSRQRRPRRKRKARKRPRGQKGNVKF